MLWEAEVLEDLTLLKLPRFFVGLGLKGLRMSFR